MLSHDFPFKVFGKDGKPYIKIEYWGEKEFVRVQNYTANQCDFDADYIVSSVEKIWSMVFLMKEIVEVESYLCMTCNNVNVVVIIPVYPSVTPSRMPVSSGA